MAKIDLKPYKIPMMFDFFAEYLLIRILGAGQLLRSQKRAQSQRGALLHLR